MTLSIHEAKAQGYLGVDFYLTKSCNKNCYYCTAWTPEMRNLDIDMDFVKPLLEWMSPYKARVMLLGGEPGLTKNLKEVIDEIKKYPNLIPSVLSNSYVRKSYPWILEDTDVHYIEHLVLDFHEDRIEKLGNYDFFEENDLNNYNVVIKTPSYYSYRKNYDITSLEQNRNTILKEYNSRSPVYGVYEQSPEFDRRICAAFPSVPVVDFEMKKIRHCSKKVINGSTPYDITKENIDKMFNFELFEFEEYCKNCLEPVSVKGKPEDLILQIMESGKTL